MSLRPPPAATEMAPPPTDVPVQPIPTEIPLPPPPATRPRPTTEVPTVPPPSPTPPPATQEPRTPVAIADGFGNPDDVAVASDGTIYFSDLGNSAINRIAPGGGKPEPVVSGLLDPEGIVVAPDGKLIVAEQKTYIIWEIDPANGSKRLLRQLENNTGKDGVDGLALDTGSGEILVPDSPNGRLLSVSRDGSRLRVIATGFDRPAGVAALPGGDLLVADEFGNAVYRVTRGGRKMLLTKMFQPDDVVVSSAGVVSVNSLAGVIYRVNLSTGALTSLLTGLKSPHGLAIAPDGRLIVTEGDANRIFSIGP